MRKVIFLLLGLLYCVPVRAQVDTGWVRRYNGPENSYDRANALAVDDSGNVYVTGIGDGIYDSSSWEPYLVESKYITIKYAPNGDILWTKRYSGPGKGVSEASALTVGDSGYVYVTGRCVNGNSGIYPNYDYGTIKYTPTGDTLWVRYYDGSGNGPDAASALKVDDSGNVYVTGYSGDDYATIKYAPNGDTLWVRRYRGPGEPWNNYNVARALAVDNSGNVYVTGVSLDSVFRTDYATIKYAPNGDTLWVRRYNGPGNYRDGAYALAVDDSGNVFVTGYSWGNSYDFATIKYAPNGDTLWLRRYNGPGNSTDAAYALAVDASCNVYVTGGSAGIETDYDFATIKYAPNGETLWVRRYSPVGSGYERPTALALDKSGNVYVTGYGPYAHDFVYITIKYDSNGDTLWSRRYNGAVNYEDLAWALAVDGSGNVYVTGTSEIYPNADYATIKYVQYTCLAKPGDIDSDSTIQVSDVVTLVNYLFKSQPAPNPLCRADANADGNVLLSDIVHLINFLFKSGPAPVKSKECCL